MVIDLRSGDLNHFFAPLSSVTVTRRLGKITHLVDLYQVIEMIKVISGF